MTAPVETSKLVLTTHCDVSITSGLAKIFINIHILLKYFELVFLQLQLVRISHKLITIQLSYERNKKNAFMVPTTLQNTFSVTFQKKMNRFP